MRLLNNWGQRLAFAVWMAVIASATVPWTDFVGHSHWQKVQWIPFRSPPVRPLDIIGNIALYVPLGYLFVRSATRRGRVWHAVALAAVVSFAVEWSQVYSHMRFPSAQDVVCNVCGAWVGASWAAR